MRIEWFVACQRADPRAGRQGTGLWPASVAHAKRLGDSRTACGEWSLTMKKMFEIPFPFEGENCRDCLVVVAEERRAARPRNARVAASGG